ncbi:autotransporter [Mesorhizobium huakuii]|nr:autotransporter [Mesorhizobium huakuii]
MVIFPSTALALVATNWLGTESSDWYTPGNWQFGLPDNTLTANITSTTPNPTVIDGGNAFTKALYMFDGTSTLTIQNAGVLSSTSGDIGLDLGSNATVTVTGGSSWALSGLLVVGDSGTGKLAISGASTVGDLDATVGRDVGSSGTVTVDGAGTNWTTGKVLTVGQFGAGTLTVSGGAVVTDQYAIVAEKFGGTGDVVVTGADSTWHTARSMKIGDSGVGTLTVQNGGLVHNEGDSSIGYGSTGKGTVTVTGIGSTMTDDTVLHVGNQGHGTLNILAGGAVNDLVSTIGFYAQSVGDATVSGAGSQWNIASTDAGNPGLVVGDNGTGSLTISNGGKVTDVNAAIGHGSVGLGTATVTGAGSSWTNSGDLNIGYFGKGSLGITNGGTVTNAGAVIGTQIDSHGQVFVDGAGSTWANGGQLGVGLAGTGLLVVSNGGKVSSSDALIGGLASGVGTVVVTGSGSSWNLQGNGSLEVGFSGSAGLQILNGGSVDAHIAYIGFKAGSDGTVVVDGASSGLVNDFTHVGTEGMGKLVLKNGGMLLSSGIVVSEVANSSGTVIIGADLAAAAAAPGYIKSPGGTGPAFSFGAGGSGALIFNHTSQNYAFDAMIDGGGTIYQKAGTTYLTADSSGYTGNAYVATGKLVVNGDLSGGSVIASDGGTVGGSGTVLNLSAETVTSGGIIAPGNSIGTLHVGNAIKFDPGSIYQVQVNAAGASDLIAAGGTATINGGTVEAQAAAGKYAASTQYAILTAAGGVSGTKYTAVTVDSPFLKASLSYDLNDVFLTLDRINANAFHDIGATPNEQAAGSGLDSVAVGNAAANALFGLGSPAQGSALDQLSGEIHASVKGLVLEDSRHVREAINDRLRRAFGDATSPSTSEATGAGAGLWTSTFGSFGTANADGNAAQLDSKTGGVFVGADGTLADGFRLGVLGGYSRGSYDSSVRNSSATADSFNAAIYGGFEAGGVGLRLGADYAVHSIDTDRFVSFTGFNDQTRAAYASHAGQVFGELGYKMGAGSTSFEPFAAAAYVRQSTDGFAETGGLSALSGEADVMAATFTTLGLRVASTFDLGTTIGTLHGSLGWRHAFGDLTPTSTMFFANGDPFIVAGAPLAVDAAVLDAGIDLAVLQDVTFGASYSGQFSKSGFENGAKANLNWQF